MMQIQFDGARKNYADGLSVAQWLEAEDIANPEVALIQVNGRDVRPNERETTVLHDGDKVALLYFLGDS